MPIYITTVSDSYAQEIQTEYYGEGLNGLLSARHFDMRWYCKRY